MKATTNTPHKTSSLTKLMRFAKAYRARFAWVIIFSIALSIFAAARPYLLKQSVDLYLIKKDHSGLLYYIGLMGIMLILEVAA